MYGISEPNVGKYSIYGACGFIYCDQYTFVLYSCSTLQWRYHHKISQVDLVEAPSTSKCFIFVITGQHWSISILLTARFPLQFSLILLSSSHGYTQAAICKWTFQLKFQVPSKFERDSSFTLHSTNKNKSKQRRKNINIPLFYPSLKVAMNRNIPSKHPPHEKTSSMQVAKHNTEVETAPHYLGSFDNKKSSWVENLPNLAALIGLIWIHSVDGQNPAPADMVNIPLFTGFHTSQVVQDINGDTR